MLKPELIVTGHDDIEAILKGCTTCRISMISDGRPYILPMVFGYDYEGDELTLYFHSGLRGKKNDALRANPQICFEMDIEGELIGKGDYGNFYSRAFSCLIGEGRVEYAQTMEERRRGIDRIMLHQTGRSGFDYQPAYLAVAEVFRVHADSFTATRKDPPGEVHFDPSMYPSVPDLEDAKY